MKQQAIEERKVQPKDVWIKGIGKNKGRSRIYLDGIQAIRAGFSPGERFEVDVQGQKVVIQKCADGSRTVASKKVSRKGEEAVIPVIDINSDKLLSVFEGMDSVRVVVTNEKVYLLPLASESRKVERLGRLVEKLKSGEPLDAGSLAHGGGVLAHAIHNGLKDAGIECNLRFANELREDLMIHAAQNNDAWNPQSAALSVPMQELAQDEWLLSQLPKLDLLDMGLPCSGASRAGMTKNQLSKMEDHTEVGHLVYSALVLISKTNPSIVLLENVTSYKDTASAQILRHQFRDMGYETHEAILDGADFGCLEKRVRWCMVATTKGMSFSFKDLHPKLKVVRTLGEVLDPSITPDDESYREVQYLKDKQERNASEGSSFKMQFVTEDSTTVPTLRKGYMKGGSTDPRLRHPTDLTKSRLLTSREHAAVKGVPPKLVEGLSESLAHQLLGQGIVYEPFRAVGQCIGEHLQHHAQLALGVSQRTIESEVEGELALEARESSQSNMSQRRRRITG